MSGPEKPRQRRRARLPWRTEGAPVQEQPGNGAFGPSSNVTGRVALTGAGESECSLGLERSL